MNPIQGVTITNKQHEAITKLESRGFIVETVEEPVINVTGPVFVYGIDGVNKVCYMVDPDGEIRK